MIPWTAAQPVSACSQNIMEKNTGYVWYESETRNQN